MVNQLQQVRNISAISNICVLLTGLLGLTVLVGWFLNLSALIQVHPEYVPMQFNTALGFLVAAIAAINWPSPLQSIKLVLASIIGLIGGLTLIQYGLDVSFGIDELFFDHYLDVKTSHPGRMAPNTALCFLLIAASLLITYRKQPGKRQLIVSTTIVVCTLALALVAAIGYLSDIEQTYGWGLYTQMAMHTSIGFVLLCVGLLIQKLIHYEQRVPTTVLSLQLGFLLFLMSLVLWQATVSRENEYVKQQIASDFEYFRNGLQEQFSAYQDATARFNKVLQLVPEDLYDALMETLTESLSGYHALLAVALGSSNGEIIWRFPASVSPELIRSSFDPGPLQGNISESMASLGHVQFAPGIGKVAALYRLPGDQDPQNKNQLINVALIDLTTLVTPIASILEERGLELNIIDSNSNVAIYGEISEKAHPHRQTFRLALHNQQWEVSVHPSSITDYDQNYALPSIVLLVGVLLTLLISALAHSLLVYRRTNNMLQQEFQRNKTSLEQLEDTQKRLKLASEVSGLGLWIWHIDSGAVEWDDQMYQIYGLEDIKGKEPVVFEHWRNSLHPEDRDRAINSLQCAVEAKAPWHEEFRIVLKSGEERHILAAATYEFDENGNIEKVIGGNKDMSEHKRNEKHLEELRQKSEQDSIAKSQFLANMSHEIRTPMNGVLGIADLLQNTDLTAVQAEYVGLITRSAKSLLTILNDILDHSKIEAGMMVLQSETISLDSFVGDLLKSFAITAHQKGLELYHYIDSDTADCVVTDPVRLRQIVYNLVGNAVKFTSAGQVVVEIRNAQHKQPPPSKKFNLEIKVTDTGCGISEDKLSHIFESFTQEDGSTSRQYGGTGLGLPIAKRLAELMGGDISVSSDVGIGSTFIATVKVEEGDVSELPISPETRHLMDSVDFSGLRCLAVDDNAINRRWLNDMVASWGGEAVLAASADEAMELLSKENFKIMLLDHNMPGKDGVQLIEEINNSDIEKPEIVIMLSSAGFYELVEHIKNLGVDHFLMKPVKQSEVFNTIHDILNHRGKLNDLPEQALTDRQALEMAKPLNILVAEDNLVNARLVQDILKMRGHQYVLASNGSEALEMVKQKRFDAILMDVQMPVMDGLEATKLIRKYERVKELPHCFIIGLTAHALSGDKEICLEAGMNEYLTKPVSFQALLDTLETVRTYNESGDYSVPVANPSTCNYVWFDEHRGLNGTGGNNAILFDMVKLTLDILPAEMDKIDLQANSSENNAKVLHLIRGMISNFTLPELPDLIYDFEKSLSDPITEQQLDTWGAIALKLESLLEELKSFYMSQQTVVVTDSSESEQ